jgi:PAS domain-containing protein
MRAVAQHPVELILLKQWASYIRVPVFVVDHAGTLVFYNEPAEAILGASFDDAGEMTLDDLPAIFKTAAPDGRELAAEDLPISIALLQRRPVHMRLRLTALNGATRIIDATSFPIEGQGQRHLGAVAMFWEPAT